MVRILDQKLTAKPHGEIKNLLQTVNSDGSWTASRREALESIRELVQQYKGLIFTSDFRTYGLQTKGAWAIFRVPGKQQGNLKSLRGENVLIICLDYADKWPGYSGRKFAALKLDDQERLVAPED
ncbi:hypothetical protein [Ruegeria arenilitoris]|uniref:hypothetical protein n=1 Tax=Ruegeria arenilitoris TaxID=1173585 RepID=UPI00147A27CF|nr:hypothetical protein [Ruegeria arenilitoris]MBY6082080.1 hypothetical protein [Ruegeria arenilitoris]